MKTIKKNASPPLLARYVADNPCATWQELKDASNGNVYKELRDQLVTDQGGLCAYCEIDLVVGASNGYDDCRVEHFVPKKNQISPSTPNYGLHWPNLLAVCHGGSRKDIASPNEDRYTGPDCSCGVPKGEKNLTGVILDPLSIPAFPPLFAFGDKDENLGEIVRAVTCPRNLETQAQRSIDELRLNSERLRKRRKVVIRGLLDAAFELSKEFPNNRDDALRVLAQSQLQKKENGNWPSYFSVFRWYFGELAEEYLKEIGYEG